MLCVRAGLTNPAVLLGLEASAAYSLSSGLSLSGPFVYIHVMASEPPPTTLVHVLISFPKMCHRAF